MAAEPEAIFRSAEMTMIQLYIPTEISKECVYALGSLGLIQFRDLNKKVNAFQRTFINEIRRLDNVERQYRFLKGEMDARGIEMIETLPGEAAAAQKFSTRTEIDEFVSDAELLETRVAQLKESSESLLKRQVDLLQHQQVLLAADGFFSQTEMNPSLIDLGDEAAALLENGGMHNQNFVTGVIPVEKVQTLEKILWRVLRGNLYMTSAPIDKPLFDPKSNKFVNKATFVVFVHGELIISRVRKICESLDADLYFVDSEAKERSKQARELNEKLTDVTTVLDTTTTTLTTELRAISVELAQWWDTIKLEKAVYTVMNLCHYDLARKCLIGEGWVPKDSLGRVKTTLERISNSSATQNDSSAIPLVINTIDTTKTPPTFHRTNKFTAAFQAMVDAYGVATYREVNPALPTAATFPFMFAIMFGDLGHGFVMFLAGLVLVLNEKKIGLMKRDEIFDMAYTGRYIVLLMGAFSMYTGFLYNDIFSISMTWFESGWKWPAHWNEGDSIEATQVGVYPFGLDPAWHGTENALLFSNSYKMKLSILMGFIHMSYSYVFSLVNAVHFKSAIDIVGNFIPGLLFMQGIFGYLTICIVYKWTVDWVAIEKPAPSLLNMLISMFLSPGTVTEELYPHQATVQVILLVIALVCVPCLLLVKPLHFKFTHKEGGYSELPTHAPVPAADDNNLLSSLNLEEDEEHEEHTFGDVMIHQVIHTIEFCLNCVSHTASYLRLWALSLAHAQLSSVLWSMTIAGSFGSTGLFGVVMTFLMFGMWFVLTVCILVVMEGTSAMLHSLRLHWVESMSKFFEGEGYAYEPFAFAQVLSAAEE